MNNTKKAITVSLVWLTGLGGALAARAGLLTPETAGNINMSVVNIGTEAGFQQGGLNFYDLAAAIIEAFLGLLGIIFLVLILLAGYHWMTSAGDEEKVRKAKETIKRAIIGLIIVVSAYSITYFVFSRLPGGGSGVGTIP